MTWDVIYETANALWVVWLMILFVAIVAWVFHPKRKQELESYGSIPLDDEDRET